MAIDPAPSNGILRHGCTLPMVAFAGAFALAAVGGNFSSLPRAPAVMPTSETGPAAHVAAPEAPATGLAAADPVPEPWRDALGGPLSRWAWNAVPVEPAEEIAPAPEAHEAPPRAVMTVPLPVPRPAELRGLGAGDPVRRAERQASRRQQAVMPSEPPTDERSFLEKLFGVERTPALAYAALESRPADLAPRRRLSPPLAPPAASGGTAVYDILARTVTLPNGERLEAHSGLGPAMDDPRQVHVKMRGATPPGTYDLTEREQPFHGVRAIRLTPVGGSESIHGRVGLLAHTYMLGPSGASNGCVSFRDYDRFLQAYLRGEIQRLVVVPGAQDALPSYADNGTGPVARVARNGG